MTLDPRVGILNRNGKTIYYAFVNKVAVEGTLDKVMRALRGQPARKERVQTMYRYTIMATVRHPNWDEANGWVGQVMAFNAKSAKKLFRERMSAIVDRTNGSLKLTVQRTKDTEDVLTDITRKLP